MTYEVEKAKHLMQLRSQVRDLLDQHPETRNNDTVLICKWLQELNISTVGSIEVNAHSISFESITRARRQIQSKGEYLPTDETVIKKRKLQDVYAAVYGNEGTL